MKTIIIILMSMITSVFYAQSSNEIEMADGLNNYVTTKIPSLIGQDYLIFDFAQNDEFILSKINNEYTIYRISSGRFINDPDIIKSKVISYSPILDKIFINFAPKNGVKKYLSEYGKDMPYPVPRPLYFILYKNGVKTFSSYLLYKIDDNIIESPIDDEIESFLYGVFVNELGFYNGTN